MSITHNQGLLDFFIDRQLIPLVHSCAHQSIDISDHAPTVLSVSLPGLPQRDRQGRFNSTLLSDNSFVEFSEKELAFFLATNLSPDMYNWIVWDAPKAYLQGQIISHHAKLKQKSCQTLPIKSRRLIDNMLRQSLYISTKSVWNSKQILTCLPLIQLNNHYKKVINVICIYVIYMVTNQTKY